MSDVLPSVVIRPAELPDLARIIALDAEMTGTEKRAYWEDIYARFTGREKRHFLVAEDPRSGGGVKGYIVGEVRAYEFGSEPCGWVVAIGVDPRFRVRRVGERLFDAVCERLRGDGVATVRTMVARADVLDMAFFRAQGMMAGPFIELEKPLD
jgi:ribosomal protein S18 acetylase RimI-like enzyme